MTKCIYQFIWLNITPFSKLHTRIFWALLKHFTCKRYIYWENMKKIHLIKIWNDIEHIDPAYWSAPRLAKAQKKHTIQQIETFQLHDFLQSYLKIPISTTQFPFALSMYLQFNCCSLDRVNIQSVPLNRTNYIYVDAAITFAIVSLNLIIFSYNKLCEQIEIGFYLSQIPHLLCSNDFV